VKEIIRILADAVNHLHDVLSHIFGAAMTDKQLHFWVMGLLGVGLYIIVYLVFKLISKFSFSIPILSFIYTFTVMIVIVFAIELEQALTNRGHMEFADAAAGIYGFLVFFIIYALVALIVYALWRTIKNRLNTK